MFPNWNEEKGNFFPILCKLRVHVCCNGCQVFRAGPTAATDDSCSRFDPGRCLCSHLCRSDRIYSISHFIQGWQPRISSIAPSTSRTTLQINLHINPLQYSLEIGENRWGEPPSSEPNVEWEPPVNQGLSTCSFQSARRI